MTALMERALEKLRTLPPERQDALAPMVMMLAEAETEGFELTPEDEVAIEQSRAQALRGEFATDEQMRAIWAKHGSLRVRYTLNAAAELAEILDYIAERSPQGAGKVQARLRAAERILAQFPEIGRLNSRKPWLRRIDLHPYPYFIFYEIAEDEVWIQRIRHGARNPTDE